MGFIRRKTGIIYRYYEVLRERAPIPFLNEALFLEKAALLLKKTNQERLGRFRGLLYYLPMEECILAVPGMTTINERKFLRWFCEHQFKGFGEIVDLGSWLGSSVVSEVVGLKKNVNLQAKKRLVHAYDIFIWQSWMNPAVNATPQEEKFRNGDSFIDEFRKIVAPWKDRICVYPGDLRKIVWKEAPIELIFVDAMKSWDLANNIIRKFFPHLIPQKSYLIHQDYAHYFTYWIHLIMFRLRDYFKVVHHVPDSGSVVFHYEKGIPTDFIEQGFQLEEFSEEEINDAYDYSQKHISRTVLQSLLASKIMLFIDKGQIGRAEEQKTVILNMNLPHTWDMDVTIKLLEKHLRFTNK